MHGRFAWYDLMTPDIAAAKKFYPAVTGWTTEDWDKGPYSMWKAGDESFAGMNPITPEQRAQGIPAHWLAYVNVDNVESSANKVRSLGGKVLHGPEDIPEVGRFAIIQDPQGATLAVFKGSGPWPGWDGTPSVGKFSWHELMTTDYRGAFEFYRQLFGWDKQSEMDMGADGMYLMYGKEGKMYGGMFNRPARVGAVPPNWTFYVNVKDVKRAVDATKKAGGTLAMGPMEVPGGDQVAVLTDPQGAMFAVHQSVGKAATAPKPRAKAKRAKAKSAKAKGAKAAKRKRPARKAANAGRKKARKTGAKRARASAKRARRPAPRRSRARSRKRGRR